MSPDNTRTVDGGHRGNVRLVIEIQAFFLAEQLAERTDHKVNALGAGLYEMEIDRFPRTARVPFCVMLRRETTGTVEQFTLRFDAIDADGKQASILPFVVAQMYPGAERALPTHSESWH